MEDPNSSSQELETMRLLFGGRGNGIANININAGGVGVWVAVTACAMTLAACIPVMVLLAMLVVDQGRKLDRTEDYLQSIFQQVPKLKAEIEASNQHQEQQN